MADGGGEGCAQQLHERAGGPCARVGPSEPSNWQGQGQPVSQWMARQGWARDKKSGPLLPGSSPTSGQAAPAAAVSTEASRAVPAGSSMHFGSDGCGRSFQILLCGGRPQTRAMTRPGPRTPIRVPSPPAYLASWISARLSAGQSGTAGSSRLRQHRVSRFGRQNCTDNIGAHCPGRVHDGAAPNPKGCFVTMFRNSDMDRTTATVLGKTLVPKKGPHYEWCRGRRDRSKETHCIPVRDRTPGNDWVR